VLAGHCLFGLHKNKTKKYDNEHQLIVVFFQCTKTKQKEMMMNVGLSSSSFNAQKQDKKISFCHCLLQLMKKGET